MKIGTATLNDMQHEFMKRYQAAIEKDSKGRIKVEIYPASQLGSIPREIEATQFGSIQAWVGPPEFLSGVDRALRSAERAEYVQRRRAREPRALNDKEFSDAFLGLGADKGLKGLALFVHGPTAFDTRKEVNSPDDLKGMKIRVLAAPLQMEQITRFGGTPVPMALDQVLPALQQGAIDGVMSDLPVFTSLHYADAAKYVYEADQSMLCLDRGDQQTVVRRAAARSAERSCRTTAPRSRATRCRGSPSSTPISTSCGLAQGGVIVTPTARCNAGDRREDGRHRPTDVLKDKPPVKEMVDLAAAAAARTK